MIDFGKARPSRVNKTERMSRSFKENGSQVPSSETVVIVSEGIIDSLRSSQRAVLRRNKCVKQAEAEVAVAYIGDVSADSYRSAAEVSGTPWIYDVDYHGLCACIHQILYLESLVIKRVQAVNAAKLGFLPAENQRKLSDDALVWAPAGTSLKRYFHQTCWSELYYTLLNRGDRDIIDKAPLEKCMDAMDTFLAGFDSKVIEVSPDPIHRPTTTPINPKPTSTVFPAPYTGHHPQTHDFTRRGPETINK